MRRKKKREMKESVIKVCEGGRGTDYVGKKRRGKDVNRKNIVN